MSRSTYTLRLTDTRGHATVFEGFEAGNLTEARGHAEDLCQEDLTTVGRGLALTSGVFAEFRRDGTERWRELGIFKLEGLPARSFRSMAEIKSANAKAGYHWFSPDTIRFFKSRVSDNWILPIPYGALFLSSERGPHGPRKYTVRRAWSCGKVDTVEGFHAHATPTAGKAAMRAEAARLVDEGSIKEGGEA